MFETNGAAEFRRRSIAKANAMTAHSLATEPPKVHRPDPAYDELLREVKSMRRELKAIRSELNELRLQRMATAPAEPPPPKLGDIHLHLPPDLKLEMKPADVHVTVSPTPVTVENRIEPTPVTIENNVAPATVENVNKIEVSPTPVTVRNEVTLPERGKQKIEYEKDRNGEMRPVRIVPE